MSKFGGWSSVAEILDQRAAEAESLDDENALLDEGQRSSVRVIAYRLRKGCRAVLVADEVGMGKTRIAVALIDAVRRCRGRTAIVMPAGLGSQWQAELRLFDPTERTLLPLRSYESFVRGFAKEGDDALTAGWQERRNARLRDRRQQRELPENDWRDERILMISHAFAGMSFPTTTNGDLPWRRELLPALEALRNGRRRNMRETGRGERRATHRAANAAFETFALQPLDIGRTQNWHNISSDDYRRAVMPVIGRALGSFDLVVIDEAHKARGEDSSLSRILGPLLWESKDAFRLGMTATPIELDVDQWRNTLKRLLNAQNIQEKDVGPGLLADVEKRVTKYAATARRLRSEPITEALVAEFESAAQDFTSALGPYVIRRDKRSDKELGAFQDKHGVDYRDVRKVSVAPGNFKKGWLRAFCAAEALSILQDTESIAKRHRLTLDKGHGLDKLILREGPEAPDIKADFWSRKVMLPAGTSIFEHPAILAAVKTIETATADGRKVLVFGTLIKPLQALTRLLDARAMLRYLAEGQQWPARAVPAGAEDAVTASLRSPDCPPGSPDNVDGVNGLLKKRYDAAHRRRNNDLKAIRREIIKLARQGENTASLILQILRAGSGSEPNGYSRIALLLDALESRVARRPESEGPGELKGWTVECVLEEALLLITELSRGAGDAFTDGMPTGVTVQEQSQFQLLTNYLDDHFVREGSFARLLYGQTPPQTRRLLQTAFNRERSWPMVLLAQSMVGREGLNLHEECRTVVLLHAEWNPGIVEQQIGRVDRKNSRFLKDYRASQLTDNGAALPRIEVHCIQTEGGYDSRQWDILEKRWIELRAQLHGDVVAIEHRQQAQTDLELAGLVRRLDLAAPNFFPQPAPRQP